ncbi:hypothetical protein KPL71_010978 [Citrus sinensis]|uniref:Uncharacterized protein n=2 Tax=Citrus TaxID=2706 RepID=A0ACB8MT62_CITSI|nr:uncharacterized protein LOC18049752 [Citrus x clementina]KAH9788766.1 hypothetical protein KPL71_010978 [Citrus sinensis]
MTGGGGESPLTPACNSGEFLLSLLQKPQQHPQAPPHQTPPQQPSLPNDPAVAAVGPTINFPPQWPSNGGDLPPTWPRTPLLLNFLGFPQNPWASPSTENQQRLLCEDLGRLGLSNANYAAIHNLIQQPNHQQQQQQNLRFGSFQVQPDSLLNLNPLDNLKYNLDRNSQFDQPRASSISNPNSFQHRNLENSREHDLRLGKQHYGSTPPPGFSNKARVAGSGNSRRGFEHNVDMTNRFTSSAVEGGNGVGLTRQLDHPGPPSGINLHSVSALDIEESLLDLRREGRGRHLGRNKRRENGPGYSQGGDDVDDFGEDLVDSLLPDDESELKNDNHERNDKKHRNSRDKEIRSDNRGKRRLSKRMRNLKLHIECRGDIGRLNAPNFKKLFEQVKAVNIDNAVTLAGVVSQIFDKALMEPTFCEMYANFFYFLAGELPDFSEDNEKITFKRLLLNKCQEEFERGEREQEEANKADKEGEIKQTEEEREEKRIKARRRWLGNIRLIGELYKKKMLTERIMHECIKKLLGQYENPDEEDVEALCILMSTIGEMIDHPKAKEHMDAYFERMEKLSNNMKLSSRVRLMLKDSIELRKNKWQQRRKVEGPKKIEEVHRDAAQERQAQASRLARGPSMNSSSRRAPMDFGPRGLSSPTTQMGSFRGLPNQNRGYGEEAKQRQLKAILNKLTPQNFEKLFEQVKAVNIDNAVTLTGVIYQIFDKALMEPTFCEMYANFCYFLAGELPDFSEDNEKITFKRLLLNKCQEEFERGEREQEEANKADKEGEIKQTEEEREEKRIKARRRWLGNIRLIGELYKKKMLTERIMHECIKKLLGQYENPDEEDVEALCILMSTIGEMIDHPKAKEHMDAYFDRMEKLSNNMKLSSRVRLMLKDSIELRKNKWQQRRKVEGPKKIEEVHRDAAQERQAQASRLARGPSMNSSSRRAPMDFGPRGLSLGTPIFNIIYYLCLVVLIWWWVQV